MAKKLTVKQKNVLVAIHILFSCLWLGPWTNEMAAITETERARALVNPTYLQNRQWVIWFGLLQTLVLVGVVVISVMKPWGKRETSKYEPKRRGV